MKAKMLSIGIIATMLSTPAVYAQKVVSVGNQAVIDASGIPHTRTPKARTTTATNRSTCTQDETDIASTVSDQKVYYKFEVSKIDNMVGIKWKEAIDYCANLTHNGSSGWRLPTKKELMLISILLPELEKQPGFTTLRNNPGVPDNAYYWSSTEQRNSRVYVMSRVVISSFFRFLDADKEDSSATIPIRCIRDIK